jgi:hypothetical protein
MEMMVWNLVLTAIVAMLGFVHKEKFAEEIFQAVLTNKNNALFFKKFSHFPAIYLTFYQVA